MSDLPEEQPRVVILGHDGVIEEPATFGCVIEAQSPQSKDRYLYPARYGAQITNERVE